MANHMNFPCYYYQHKIQIIWFNVSFSAAMTLKDLFILTIFNYCNSLLADLLKFRILQLHFISIMVTFQSTKVFSCVRLYEERTKFKIFQLGKPYAWTPHWQCQGVYVPVLKQLAWQFLHSLLVEICRCHSSSHQLKPSCHFMYQTAVLL